MTIKNSKAAALLDELLKDYRKPEDILGSRKNGVTHYLYLYSQRRNSEKGRFNIQLTIS
jgi:hypothetical protein